MKILSALAALSISFIALSATHAQSGMAVENWKDIKFGPMFTAGAAVNAGPVVEGTKTSPGFSFSTGGRATFPLSAQIAFDLGLCYDGRNVSYHTETSSDTGVSLSAMYMELRPGFNLGGFTIGIGIGLPLALSQTSKPTALPVTAFTPSFTSSDMNMLFEGRIGGAITVMSSDEGILNVLIEASYPFNQTIKSSSFSSFLSDSDKAKNNGPLAKLELGLAYLFDLTPH